MSYLPIQGTAVPSEHVFSSSSETTTKCWNRLQPEMMEALQMLKFLRKKERLDWMKKFIVMEGELIAEVQSDALADLTQAVDKDQLDILTQILGDADARDTWEAAGNEETC